MCIFDKMIWVVLGWTGLLVDLMRFLGQYIIGLIWILYSAIRGRNYRKQFTGMNRHAIKELREISKEFITFVKESV